MNINGKLQEGDSPDNFRVASGNQLATALLEFQNQST